MADSAKLYVNPKWTTNDLIDVVHVHVNRVFGTTLLPEVKRDTMNDTVWMYYQLKTGPGMVMITRSDLGGIPCVLIDASARREKSKGLLSTIGKSLGGMFTDNEAHGMFEEIEDPFADNEFMLMQIQKGGSYYEVLNNRTNKDIDELVENLLKLKKPEDTNG